MLFYDNITDAGFVFNSREKARWCNTQIMAYAAHHWGSTYNVSLAGASYKSTRLRFGGLRSLKISEWIRVHGPKSRIQNLNHLLQFHCFTVSDISIMNLSHCPCLHPLFYPPPLQWVPLLFSCLPVCDPLDVIRVSCLRMGGRLFIRARQLPNGYTRRENGIPSPSNH